MDVVGRSASGTAVIEIEWTSGWSMGQRYPSPGPAISDIHHAPGWPGSEHARRCPELDYQADTPYQSGYCVDPFSVPLDTTHDALLYYGFDHYRAPCSVCPVEDQFGIERCGSFTTLCTDEASVFNAINAKFGNMSVYCAHSIEHEHPWILLGIGPGPKLDDGHYTYTLWQQRYIEVKFAERSEITGCDPLVFEQPFLWFQTSFAFDRCPEGYPYPFLPIDLEESACTNHFQAWLSMYGAPIEQNSGRCASGNPCHPTTGVKSLNEPDFTSPTLDFVRYYQSDMYYQDYASMGRGWSHNFSERILPLDFDSKRHLNGKGNIERFHCTDAPSCSLYRSENKSGSLLKPIAGGWELLAPNGTLKVFDNDGKLISIEDRAGSYRSISITYTSDDKVDAVMDQQGRLLQFAYNADGLVNTITLPSGATIQYQYKHPASMPPFVGWNQQLVKVIREDLSEVSTTTKTKTLTPARVMNSW